MDQGYRFHPPDQGNEDAIERSYLGFTEAIDIGQEQVRHLLQNSGIPLEPTHPWRSRPVPRLNSAMLRQPWLVWLHINRPAG